MPNLFPAAAPLGLTLPVGKGNIGYFATTTNALNQVKTNLTSLLLTLPGERIMEPNFGCNLPAILFQNSTNQTLAEIQAAIQTAVQTWMPFVNITNVTVTPNQDQNSVQVAVTFALLTSRNMTATIVLQFS